MPKRKAKEPTMDKHRSREEKTKAARFAKAMARAEFGRFFVDDRDVQEVRRSNTSRATVIAIPHKDR